MRDLVESVNRLTSTVGLFQAFLLHNEGESFVQQLENSILHETNAAHLKVGKYDSLLAETPPRTIAQPVLCQPSESDKNLPQILQTSFPTTLGPQVTLPESVQGEEIETDPMVISLNSSAGQKKETLDMNPKQAHRIHKLRVARQRLEEAQSLHVHGEKRILEGKETALMGQRYSRGMKYLPAEEAMGMKEEGLEGERKRRRTEVGVK